MVKGGFPGFGGGNMNNLMKQAQKMQKDMLAFLEDEKIVNYINKNFSCYKFSATAESVNFQGKEYKQTAEKGRSSHEFTFFLTETNRNNFPVIVLIMYVLTIILSICIILFT